MIKKIIDKLAENSGNDDELRIFLTRTFKKEKDEELSQWRKYYMNAIKKAVKDKE